MILQRNVVSRSKKRKKHPVFSSASPTANVPSKTPQRQPTIKSIEATAWKGPLPDPNTLREFDSIITNGAERIMAQFEKQSDHRQLLERTVVESRSANMRRGQWFALIIALFALTVAGYCANIGESTAATVIASIDIVGLAGVFIYGSHVQREERRQRLKTE